MIDYDDELTSPFWRAAEQGQFVLSWCLTCDESVWYPEESCPRCGDAVSWKELSGEGRLHSWTHVQMPVNPNFAPGYITGLVVPDEALEARVVSNIVCDDPEELRCDMNVRVEFQILQTLDGQSYHAPVFRPVL